MRSPTSRDESEPQQAFRESRTHKICTPKAKRADGGLQRAHGPLPASFFASLCIPFRSDGYGDRNPKVDRFRGEVPLCRCNSGSTAADQLLTVCSSLFSIRFHVKTHPSHLTGVCRNDGAETAYYQDKEINTKPTPTRSYSSG